MRVCFRCNGLTWIANGEIEDGMMTGRGTCPNCKGSGTVTEEDVLDELTQLLGRARAIK